MNTDDAAGLAASTERDRLTWREFEAAMRGLIGSSCCSSVGLAAAAPAGHFGPLVAKGYAAWSATVKRSAPRVRIDTGPLVLPDVTIVEPGKPALERVDIEVADSRIARIVPAGSAPRGDARVIEAARGRFVAPALADMHVHMPPANVLNLTPIFLLLTLRHGITLVRDAGDPDGTATPAALALVRSGAFPGPEMRFANAFVTAGPARWANSILYERADQATAVVARLKHSGATWVKSYENLSLDRLTALYSAAKDAGLGVMGHVPTPLRHEDALVPDAQHFFGVPEPTSLRRDHVLNRQIDWDSVTNARMDTVVDVSVRHGLALTPTLSATSALSRMANYEEECHAADVRMLPSLYADVVWHPVHGVPAYRNISREDFARLTRAHEQKLALLSKLAAAGVTLRLGTDTQQPFVLPGIALHREIAEFELAGISRESAWESASALAAAALGIEGFGRFVPGARADLIVSEGSPMMPGWTPQRIRGVCARGALMLREDLDASIAAELRRFEGAIQGFVSQWLARMALNRAAKNFIG